jgi:hypothetical protein
VGTLNVGDVTTTTELTDEERGILDLERSWWKFPGAKETEIRARFDMSLTRYCQVLDRLMDEPAAEVWDAALCRRLRRLREARRAQRSGY